MSNAFTKFTTDCGIERQHTVRARPQQNGVAERANRVLSERLTTMLDKSGLPKAFWAEALGVLVHVWNRCSTDAVKNATPYQLWTGTKPDVSHLRTLMSIKFLIPPSPDIAIGSHSLMTTQDSDLCSQSRPSQTFLKHSRISRPMQRTSPDTGSRS